MNRLRTVAEGLDHPECVAWGADGLLYAGGEGGQIYRIDPVAGIAEQFASTGGFVLGVATDSRANVYACDLNLRAVISITPDGTIRTLSSGTEQVPMQTPNALAFDSRGNLYVSDSGSWEDGGGGIYRVDSEGVTTEWSRDGFRFANGIALSADERWLYVVESTLPGVTRVPIDVDGVAGKREVVVELPGTVPDGIAFDSEGGLYISCYRPDAIFVMESGGEPRILVEDPQGTALSAPTNIAFGGIGMRTMYVANFARWHVAAIELDVVGLDLHRP